MADKEIRLTSSLFVLRATEKFERSMLRLPLQLCSPNFPPITRTDGTVLETRTVPDIQLSFAKWMRSSVCSVGYILIGMDIGVNQSRLAGGFGESGSSIVGAIKTARIGKGSPLEVTVI